MIDQDYTWFWDFLRHLEANPWTLQVWVAAFATFIMENVVCAGIGMLVASGDMRVDVAFAAMSGGVFIGDILIYLPGRFAMSYIDKTQWMQRNRYRLQLFEEFFSRHVGKTMFIIRFTPGIRSVALLAAGMLRVNFYSYVVYSFLSSMFQAALVILLAKGVLAELLPHIREIWRDYPQSRYVIVGAALLIFWLINKIIGAVMTKKVDRSSPNIPSQKSPFVWYESLSPFWFNMTPVLYYFWLGIRNRSLTLGLNVNPAFYNSGFNGERKQDIYGLFPRALMGKVVAQVAVVSPVSGSWAEARLKKAKTLMEENGLSFPVVAKPDIGQRGVGVQKIESEFELLDYINHFPSDETFLLQELITLPEEGAVLYVRYPGEPRGRITALTYKQFVFVVGDGTHTLRQLILADTRGLQLSGLYLSKHCARLDQVVPGGERIYLNFAGNHGQGTVFKPASDRITPALERYFDAIARQIEGFYYGRFDFRFESWERLAAGEGIRIIELNGIGGEPVEIWDPDGSLNTAYEWLRRQCRIFFEIGRLNRQAGHKPPSFRQVIRDWFRVRELVKRYPPAD